MKFPPTSGAARESLFPESLFPEVLFLATSTGSGGLERHSVRLAADLRRCGVPVRYACREGSFLDELCRRAAVPTHPLAVRNSGDLRAAFALAALLKAQQTRVLHVHSRRDFVVSALAAKLCRNQAPALVLHSHLNKPLGQPGRATDLFFAHTARAVVAVSEPVRETLARAHPACAPLLRVIPNGVAPAAGPKRRAQQRAAARRRWGVPPDALVVGMVGRLNCKGQERVLSLGRALSGGVAPPWFVLIGAEGADGEAARLAATAERQGVAPRVVFAGPQDDAAALMPAFDLLAHLPEDEAFGLTLAEAMACGLPVLASTAGGCREVVRDGVTGLLAAPEDRAAQLAAFERLLDPRTGAALRRRLGDAGREVAGREYALALQTRRTLALYRSFTAPGLLPADFHLSSPPLPGPTPQREAGAAPTRTP